MGEDSKQLYERRQLQAIAARWDAKAGDWERQLQQAGCHLNEDRAYERFLENAARVIDQRREFCRDNGLIDCGCATGLVLEALVPSFAWGIGVDISPEMIRIASAKKLPKAQFVLGDCFDLARCAPPAGAVISRGVLLSHYGTLQALALLQSARAALVSGGFLLCDFLNDNARSRNQHRPENKTYFSSADVCALALQAGFKGAVTLGESERRVLMLAAYY